MPTILRISDLDEKGFLAVTMADLLSIVGRGGERLTWIIWDLAISGFLEGGKAVQELEQESAAAPHGIIATWTELWSLASQLTQVRDGLFGGCSNPSGFPQIGDENALFDTCEIVLQAVDAGWWEVRVRDDALVRKLQEAFRDVTVENSSR